MLLNTGYTAVAARLLPNLLRRDAIFVVVGNEDACVNIDLEASWTKGLAFENRRPRARP